MQDGSVPCSRCGNSIVYCECPEADPKDFERMCFLADKGGRVYIRFNPGNGWLAMDASNGLEIPVNEQPDIRTCIDKMMEWWDKKPKKN